MNPAARIVVVFLVLGFAGCATQRPRSQALPAAPAAPALQDPLDSIARFEDMRTDGDGLLQALAARGEARTRERAVRALGRLALAEHGAIVSDSIAHALEDDAEPVRAAAAFALGERADPTTVGALLAAIDDASLEVRVRAIEALSRIDDPRARRAVIDALRSPTPEITRIAAIGIQRFAKLAPETAAAEAELVRAIAPSADVELRWRALATLARRACDGARAEFERGAKSNDARERIFALQGLGAIASDANASATAIAALADPDWRVACEAANALGKHADANAVAALVDATARAVPPHASHHVRRSAFDALGRIPGAGDAARVALERARTDESSAVRAAAIEAGARLHRGGALSALESAAQDADAIVRAGVAAACAHVEYESAAPLLERLADDPDLRVATSAVDALGEHAGEPRARELLRELANAKDYGVRLSAVTALKTAATAADLPALERALASTRGEIGPEVAAAIVDAAAKVGGDEGRALVVRAIAYPDAYVARRAREAANTLRPGAALPRVAALPRRSSVLPPAHVGPNPRVAIETTRGTLHFELLPDEAPFHVANFLELAGRGHYDGTRFHRVVADFVAQGGDLRGDGNGGRTWRGDALRAEFGPRPYLRGSLGMPRNDDPDSGGSQIFVTHRETPHLDLRYTLFGRLVGASGEATSADHDVLDAIQVGDVIRRVLVPAADG